MKITHLAAISLLCLGYGQVAQAKYLKLPASCRYITHKKTSTVSQKDLRCFIKYASVQINKVLPKSGESGRLLELIPSKSTLIFRTEYTGIRSAKSMGERKWARFKQKKIKRSRRSICKESSPFYFIVANGGTIKVNAKNRAGGRFSYTVDWTDCL